MITLSIETSCDETSVAVVKNGTGVLSLVTASSEKLHAKTRGIVPEVAARKQVEYMIPVVREALRKSGIAVGDIDRIAVTNGPGLVGSLVVGVNTAKALSFAWGKEIGVVNHIKGHLYSSFLQKESPALPFVSLVASGGHTELYLVKQHGEYIWLGGTRDDAAGECFDKIGRVLGLPYPGGVYVDEMAEKFESENPKFKPTLFPRPLLSKDTLDFSFSGLKTSVYRKVSKMGQLKTQDVKRLSFEAREAIVDVLEKKLIKATKKMGTFNVSVSGGVAANKGLRKRLKKYREYSVTLCPKEYCTDNAAMIATADYFDPETMKTEDISAKPSLSSEMLNQV